jgi:hypothetical protein
MRLRLVSSSQEFVLIWSSEAARGEAQFLIP